jgi:hypothetical protein
MVTIDNYQSIDNLKEVSYMAALDENELYRYIGNVEFPADKGTIIGTAQQNRAPSSYIEQLSSIPAGEYQNTREVYAELAGGSRLLDF